MINDITSDTEDGMKKAVDSFKRDLQKIRTGRANTAMLDGIKVDYYGTPTPVNQVATVQVVDARLITVKPWEKTMLAVIDKAIRASDLGINPVADSEIYKVMKSYAPYDNVEAKDYPAMLVTGGLNDPRVSYWEPAKWVAKLRTMKTDDHPLLLKTEMGAGHGGPSGRYDAWRDEALVLAFLLDQLAVV